MPCGGGTDGGGLQVVVCTVRRMCVSNSLFTCTSVWRGGCAVVWGVSNKHVHMHNLV